MARGCFKYDWSIIQQYYDDGHGCLQCRAQFGFAKDTWIKAIRTGRLLRRPRQWSLERVLSTSKSRYTVKRRLITAGILKNICDDCGLSEWRSRPLTIQVDHRNGNRNDHRLENLRMLCPNCHSQTETYAARNKKWRCRLDGTAPNCKRPAAGVSPPRDGAATNRKDRCPAASNTGLRPRPSRRHAVRQLALQPFWVAHAP